MHKHVHAHALLNHISDMCTYLPSPRSQSSELKFCRQVCLDKGFVAELLELRMQRMRMDLGFHLSTLACRSYTLFVSRDKTTLKNPGVTWHARALSILYQAIGRCCRISGVVRKCCSRSPLFTSYKPYSSKLRVTYRFLEWICLTLLSFPIRIPPPNDPSERRALFPLLASYAGRHSTSEKGHRTTPESIGEGYTSDRKSVV